MYRKLRVKFCNGLNITKAEENDRSSKSPTTLSVTSTSPTKTYLSSLISRTPFHSLVSKLSSSVSDPLHLAGSGSTSGNVYPDPGSKQIVIN